MYDSVLWRWKIIHRFHVHDVVNTFLFGIDLSLHISTNAVDVREIRRSRIGRHDDSRIIGDEHGICSGIRGHDPR
jgi:hypothetical protein